jgi:N-acetylmuramoyl-L-alanine amidase
MALSCPRARLVLALAAPALVAAQEPEPPPAEFLGRLPDGATAPMRLVFRKGLQIEARRLPKKFLLRRTEAPWIFFEDLSPEGKRWALKAAFPDDVWTKEEVRHFVRHAEVESVWLMASHFTGHGQNYDRLEALNPKNPEKLVAGDLWRIPRELLSKDLGGQGLAPDRSQPEDGLDDEARVKAYRALLSFDQDREGKFAAYRLRRGEALWSSVVMRYTDRVDAKEVNRAAELIAKRSGIADVRSIQPGTTIRIPLALLSDPFQLEGSQALREEQEVREEVRRTPKLEAGPRLGGVRIVLDAGHGGRDKGAMANGLWESDFVYDIAMRTKRILEQDTEASVSSTILYPRLGFKTREDIRRPSDIAQIQTTPPFPIDGESPTAVSVHLRWVLANDLFSAFVKKKGDPKKTIFLSFHADSLHPTARGTMVYVPGAASVPSTFGLAGRRAANVKEMKASGHVVFSAREKVQGEARSRVFSELLLRELQKAKLPIHPNRAIRNVIHREGKNFVPAAIRHNAAATKVLIEVANLTNEADVENLTDPAFRESYAEAVVKAVRAYYKKS